MTPPIAELIFAAILFAMMIGGAIAVSCYTKAHEYHPRNRVPPTMTRRER